MLTKGNPLELTKMNVFIMLNVSDGFMKCLKRPHWIIVSVVLLIHCSAKKDTVQESIVYPQMEHQMGQLDKAYFDMISDFQFYESELYLIARSTPYVVYRLGDDYQIEGAFGKKGHGPGEFVDATKFDINEDTVFVVDAGKIRMLSYSIEGEFVEELNLTDRNYTTNNFSVDASGNFFTASPSNEFPIAIINRAKNEVKNFGARIQYSNEMDDMINNRFHVHKTPSSIVSISTSNPVISIYDLSGEKRGDIALPENLVKSRLAYRQSEIKKDPEKRHFEYILNYDTYIYKDELYVLICENTKEDGFICNKIAVFSNIDSAPTFKTIVQLPGEVYETFCVNGEKIVAYETTTNTIQFLSLPDDD